MKNIIITILLSLPFIINAQLINDGVKLIVESGTTLYVESSLNNNVGTIHLKDNSNLIITGDFTSKNTATLNAELNSIVRFIGINSTELKSGKDDFGRIVINKNGVNSLILQDSLTVKTDIEFSLDNQNKLNLNSFNLNLKPSASITNAGEQRYIKAYGSGKVIKMMGNLESFTYPIGDIDDYSPITVNSNSGDFNSSSSIGVNVVDLTHPDIYSESDSYISRYWRVQSNNIENWEATLTGTYTDADINGTENKIVGANFNSSNWSFVNSSGNHVDNTISVNTYGDNISFTGMNFYGSMSNLKVFLHGAYDINGHQTTYLNSSDLIPVTSPFGTGETVDDIPSIGITDWVKIELRDSSDPSIILKSYSKFLIDNGRVVDLDGVSLPRFIDAPSSAYIAIRHRNHLGIRTNNSIDLISVPHITYDFTTASNQAYGIDPMKEVESGVWAMWGGNTNDDESVRAKQIFVPGSGTIYSDRDYILNNVLLGDVNGQLDDYNDGDTNMDGHVRAKQIFIPGSGTIYSDRDFILNKVLLGNTNGQIDEQL